jgi:CRP-like cAMP-binding protein
MMEGSASPSRPRRASSGGSEAVGSKRAIITELLQQGRRCEIAQLGATKLDVDSLKKQTNEHMQGVMGLYLEQMKKDLTSCWPHLEPEHALIYWLCERRGLRAPSMSLKRVSKPPSTFDAAPRHVAATPKLVDSRVASPDDLACSADVSTAAFAVDSPGVASSPDVPRTSSTSPCWDEWPLSEQLGARKPPREQVQLRALPQLKSWVTQDAMHWQGMQSAIRSQGSSIVRQVANMRSEFHLKKMNRVPMLSDKILTADEQFLLVGRLQPGQYTKQDKVIEEGAVGDRLFIIERGECEVIKEVHGVTKPVMRMGKGDYFGEMGVLYDMPRSATVVAMTNLTVLSLDRDAIYKTLCAEKIDAMKILARRQVFASIPLFSPLDADIKSRIAVALRTDVWRAGAVIFRENDMVAGEQKRLYILVKGQCIKTEMVTVPIHHQKEQTTVLQRRRSVFMTEDTLQAPGSHFGVLECLHGCRHQYTLKTVTDAQTLSISHDELSDLLGDKSKETFEMMNESVRRSLVIEILARADPDWRYVDEKRLDRMLRSSETKRYGKWDAIFNQGETMKTICMLEQGSCVEYDFNIDLLKSPDQHTFESVDNVEHSMPGDHLGTVCFLDGSRCAVARNAMVSISECRVLHIDIEIIERETQGMKQDFATQFLV